jgi:hypothetical protein
MQQQYICNKYIYICNKYIYNKYGGVIHKNIISNQRKTIGKPEENQRKTIGKPEENQQNL